MSGKADVIVCDGFIGNVVLKVSEAVAETIGLFLRTDIEKSLIRKIGYLLVRPAFQNLKHRVDYAEYGGAPLVGINGISIISHGRSSDRAIKNAVRVATELAKSEVNKHVHDDIEKNMELTRTK
jgi:glycerol-3-phosphate acyltransferase PlsX